MRQLRHASSPHFLLSLADRKKCTDGETSKIPGGKLNGCEFSESRTQQGNTLNASIQTKPTQQGNSELMTGNYATYGSLVRWPLYLNAFRCTVCLMVNHLKSTSADSTIEDGLRSELQVNKDETEAFNQKLGMQRAETTTSFTSNSASWANTGTLPSEPDAQMLLPGDFDENGAWWIGSGQAAPSASATISKNQPERVSAARVSLRTPGIHWEELSGGTKWFSLRVVPGEI